MFSDLLCSTVKFSVSTLYCCVDSSWADCQDWRLIVFTQVTYQNLLNMESHHSEALMLVIRFLHTRPVQLFTTILSERWFIDSLQRPLCLCTNRDFSRLMWVNVLISALSTGNVVNFEELIEARCEGQLDVMLSDRSPRSLNSSNWALQQESGQTSPQLLLWLKYSPNLKR